MMLSCLCVITIASADHLRASGFAIIMSFDGHVVFFLAHPAPELKPGNINEFAFPQDHSSSYAFI